MTWPEFQEALIRIADCLGDQFEVFSGLWLSQADRLLDKKIEALVTSTAKKYLHPRFIAEYQSLLEEEFRYKGALSIGELTPPLQ